MHPEAKEPQVHERLSGSDQMEQRIRAYINMPKLNGVEATVKIKSLYPDSIIIGLSVQKGGQAQQALLAAGAAMLLTKEAAVDELYQAIVSGLKRRQEALAGEALNLRVQN